MNNDLLRPLTSKEVDTYHRNGVVLLTGMFDEDWIKDSNSIYKGIDSNWCRVIFDNGLTIKHNELREYPIYYTKNSISNFYKHS